MLTFEKSFADIGAGEKLKTIDLLNYGEVDNLIVVIKESGESKMMSKDIIQMMLDYQKSTK